MVVHVGSSVEGKTSSIERFITNFKKYPVEITSRLMLENDDKTFTAKEVLQLCKAIKIPMVLDVHHHNCNNDGEPLAPMLKDIFSTWDGEYFPPKIHFSTPRDGEKDRKHSDYINAEDFAAFIEKCIPINRDIDVMLEAKMKDLSLFKLAEDIKSIRPHWTWLDTSTIEI